MNSNECLEKLKVACNDLSNIGNIVEFKKNNPNALFGKIKPVIQYYKYIQNNFKNEEFVLVESLSDVIEIGENNPSLKGIIDIIIEDKKINRETKDGSFDKSSLINNISALIEEIRSQKNYNSIDDYQMELQKYEKELDDKKEYFSQEEYNFLNNAIKKELFTIERLTQIDERIIKNM